MGSWFDLAVDGLSIWGGKSYVDDLTLSVFQESDRKVVLGREVSEDDDEEQDQYRYVVSAHEMKDRLDVLGFSAVNARVDYEYGRAENLKIWEDRDDEFYKGVFEEVSSKNYARWQTALQNAVPLGYARWMYDDERWRTNPDAKILKDDSGLGLGAYFSDPRFLLRGVLDALPDTKEVILDFSHLISGGYYEPDTSLCLQAREQATATPPIFGPTVILTEGKSDSRVISAALSKLMPHLVDYFSFLDFETLKIQGSTDALAKMVRAFIGARVSMRMVAVFDNDTAGVMGLKSLADIKFPPNVKAITLPDCDIARQYPTEGPQGFTRMDVNGLAASIELYLGSVALSDDNGKLRPVRWTGYDVKAGRYQGVVEGKSQIEQKFVTELKSVSSSDQARVMFPDMDHVIRSIVFLFRNDVQAPPAPQDF